MGKSKKSKSSKTDTDRHSRNIPLSEQILEDKSIRQSGRSKTRQRRDCDEEFVGDRLSKKILDQARQQQQELEEEHSWSGPSSSNQAETRKKKTALTCKTTASSEDDDDSSDDDETEEFYEDIEVDAEDEKALELFMSHNKAAQRTLADIIQEKLTEKKTEIQTQMTDNGSVQMQQLDERVVNMYHSVRDILAKYRSGKLPKAFKIIPSLANWEQILYATEPEKWSAAAMYQATRIFASNLNAQMAQRFFNLVLFPRIRDDIAEYKRLNFHLYMAVQKSLFKPAAFFKGILLPLCECGTCTLREAIIISSILAKNSIPILHSAAAMLKIAEMDYNGANSIFLRTLLDKKYALPYRVVDAMVHHFIRFQTDKRELPVLWHQCLLTFVQRYKGDISTEQKQAFMDLLRAQTHEHITPEIRRELIRSKCRDEEDAVPPDSHMEDD